MSMAQRTIAELRGLSAPAVRTEPPIVWPADVSAATPRHLPLPAGGGRRRAGLGGAGGEGGYWGVWV